MALQAESPHGAAAAFTAKASEVCELVQVVQALCSPQELREPDAGLQTALERLVEASQSLQATAAAQEQELRSTARPAAQPAPDWKGPHQAAMCRLGEGLAEFSSSLDALPRCLPEADAEEERQAVRQRMAALLNPGEGSMKEAEAELACLQQDLSGQAPLQSLLGLREMKLLGGRGSESRLGQVVSEMAADVGRLLEKHGGERPVPFAKEDAVMRSLIKRHICDVIAKLEEEEEICDLLSTRLDRKEEALREAILELSMTLSQGALRGRGVKEQERSGKMKELIDFYLERLMATQSKPNGLLLEKQQDLQAEAQEDFEAYRSLQKYHADRAVAIRQQQQQLVELVSEFEHESHEEEQKARVWDEVHALREQLRSCLDRATALSELCCKLDRKQLACEEAERLRQGGLPLLQEAVQRHVQARHRVAQGEELLAGFASCLMRAYDGLREKADQDLKECRERAPLYGARCLAVKEQLHRDIQAQRQRAMHLQGQAAKEQERLNEVLEMLEQTDNGDGFEEAAAQCEIGEVRLETFHKTLVSLSEMERSISESAELRFAEEAATAAEGMLSSAKQWLEGFFFTLGRRCSSSSLPALAEGKEASIHGNLRLTNKHPMMLRGGEERAMLADGTSIAPSDFSIIEDAAGLSPRVAGE